MIIATYSSKCVMIIASNSFKWMMIISSSSSKWMMIMSGRVSDGPSIASNSSKCMMIMSGRVSDGKRNHQYLEVNNVSFVSIANPGLKLLMALKKYLIIMIIVSA